MASTELRMRNPMQPKKPENRKVRLTRNRGPMIGVLEQGTQFEVVDRRQRLANSSEECRRRHAPVRFENYAQAIRRS